MKKHIEAEIEVPSLPNFLRNVVKGREKAILVPIQDFTEAELREIASEWTEKWVKLATKKRKQMERHHIR